MRRWAWLLGASIACGAPEQAASLPVEAAGPVPTPTLIMSAMAAGVDFTMSVEEIRMILEASEKDGMLDTEQIADGCVDGHSNLLPSPSGEGPGVGTCGFGLQGWRRLQSPTPTPPLKGRGAWLTPRPALRPSR